MAKAVAKSKENRSEIKAIRAGRKAAPPASARKALKKSAGQAAQSRRQAGGARPLSRRPPGRNKPAAEAVKSGKWVYHLRRRQGRGQSRPARSARRQGRQSRRDGQSRPAGASRLHHSDLGLHLFLRARQILSEGIEGAGREGARPCRQADRQGVRRFQKSAAGVGALRRPRLDAGHDGHRAQPRPQRPDRRSAGRNVRRPPLRL